MTALAVRLGKPAAPVGVAVGDGRPEVATVIVCAGNQPTQAIEPRLLNWLRRMDRHGVRLGALDTGIFALAEAGLMSGYRMTLHWEAIPLFRTVLDRRPGDPGALDNLVTHLRLAGRIDEADVLQPPASAATP